MKKKCLSSKVHTCFGSMPTLTYPAINKGRAKRWGEAAKIQRKLTEKYEQDAAKLKGTGGK